MLRHLSASDGATAEALPERAVVVARTMGPAELLDYARHGILGLVVEEAGQTSHIAIVARSMGIPLVGGAEGVADIARGGDAIVVDAESGEVRIRPPKEIVNAYRGKQALLAQRVAQFAAIRDQPAITRDGTRITLNMNAGLVLDLPHLTDSGADGIGLFRTELQFLIGAKMPRLADQIALYRQVLDAAGGKPVVFRTLDLGGDKIPSYGRTAREENPALGWRAIRIALDRPGLLRYQMRALIMAAQGRPLRVMLPMIAELREFEQARLLIGKELERAERVGIATPGELRLGAMIEVPSLLFGLEQILSNADFLSVGSNDLLQFAFACDRTNPKVARRYDTLAPCVLSLLRHIATTANRLNRLTSVSVCGEIAGRPLEAMVLLALGFTSLSMHASMIGPVKMMARALDTRLLRPLVLELCGSSDATVRPLLLDFTERHGIPVGR